MSRGPVQQGSLTKHLNDLLSVANDDDIIPSSVSMLSSFRAESCKESNRNLVKSTNLFSLT